MRMLTFAKFTDPQGLSANTSAAVLAGYLQGLICRDFELLKINCTQALAPPRGAATFTGGLARAGIASIGMVFFTGHFIKESTRDGIPLFAPFLSPEAETQGQAILGTSDPDVAEPSLFINGLATLVGNRSVVGQ